MKVRTNFVTNSSSSSFILAFNNNDKWSSYDAFIERCDYLDYNEFAELIKHLKKNQDNINKEDALELLYNYYSFKYKWDMLDAKIHRHDYQKGDEYYSARNKLEKSDEFKKELELKIMSDHEYLEKKKQIENADLVIQGMIWDTEGGLLEWAIRNGFIKDNFYYNHVITWNVG